MMWSTEENLKILKLPKKIYQSPSTSQHCRKNQKTLKLPKKINQQCQSTLTADFSVSRRAAQTRRWKFLQGLETFRNHNQMLVIWDMINDYDYNYDFDYDNEYTWTFMQGPLPHFVVIIRVHEWSSHLCPERLPQAARVWKAELSLEPDEKPAEAEIQIPRFLEI